MTVVDTKFGRVISPDGRCKDNYDLIEVMHRDGQVTKLQHGAMESFKDACRAYAKRTRPHDTFRLINLSGSWRSCSYQTQLHNSDPQRFADPNYSLHCRGLAIDVINPVPQLLRGLLKARDWHQARPDDEPWHFSYWFSG